MKIPVWLKFSAAVGVVGGGLVLFLFNPESYPYPHCLFHDLTGLYCPGCGSTRALYQLLHGHLLNALHDNVTAVLAIPFFIYAAIRKEPLSQIHPIWIWAIFYSIVIFTILRNIPLFPFTCLAPLN